LFSSFSIPVTNEEDLAVVLVLVLVLLVDLVDLIPGHLNEEDHVLDHLKDTLVRDLHENTQDPLPQRKPLNRVVLIHVHILVLIHAVAIHLEAVAGVEAILDRVLAVVLLQEVNHQERGVDHVQDAPNVLIRVLQALNHYLQYYTLAI